MKKEFNEIPRMKGQAIEVGMGASGTYWTDMTPYEVVRVVSAKTIDIRELDVEITGGNWLDPKYKLISNDENPVVRARLGKMGWKLADGMKIYVGHARYYCDPSF